MKYLNDFTKDLFYILRQILKNFISWRYFRKVCHGACFVGQKFWPWKERKIARTVVSRKLQANRLQANGLQANRLQVKRLQANRLQVNRL